MFYTVCWSKRPIARAILSHSLSKPLRLNSCNYNIASIEPVARTANDQTRTAETPYYHEMTNALCGGGAIYNAHVSRPICVYMCTFIRDFPYGKSLKFC